MYLYTDELVQASSSINISSKTGVDTTSYDTLLPSLETSFLDSLSLSNQEQPISDPFICDCIMEALSNSDALANLPPNLTTQESLATLKTYLNEGPEALASYELTTVDQFLTLLQTPSIANDFNLNSSHLPLIKESQQSLPLERITLIDQAKTLRDHLKQVNDISQEEQLFRNRAFLFEPDNSQLEFLAHTLYENNILTHDMSIEETAAAVLNYVQTNFTYQHDSVPDRLSRAEARKGNNDEVYDYWQSVSETLALGSGDCEDLALLTGSLLSSVLTVGKGLSAEEVSKMITISAGYLPEQYGFQAGHTVVKLRLDDQVLALDATSSKGPIEFSSLGLKEVLEFNDRIFTTYQRIDAHFTTANSLDILLVDETAFGEEGSANEILLDAYNANKDTILFQINLAIQLISDQIREPITLPKLLNGSLYGDYVAANYQNAVGSTDTEKKIQALLDFAASLGIISDGATDITLSAEEQAYLDAVDAYSEANSVITSMKEYMTERSFGPPSGMTVDSVMAYVMLQNPDLAMGDSNGDGYDDLYDKFFIKNTDPTSASYNKYVFIGTPFDGESVSSASTLYTEYGTPVGYEWVDITSSDYNSGGLTLDEINELYDANSLVIGDIESNINAAIESGDFLLQIYDGDDLLVDWGTPMDYASILLDDSYTFVTGDASSAEQLLQYQTELQPLYDQQNQYEEYRNSYNIVFAALDGITAYYTNELSKQTPPAPDTSMESPPYYSRTVTASEAAADSSLIKGQLVEINSDSELALAIAQMLDTLQNIDELEKSIAQKELDLSRIPASDKNSIDALQEEIDVLNDRIRDYEDELTIIHQFIDRDFANDLNSSGAYKFFNIYTFDQNNTVSTGEGYAQTVQSLVMNSDALFDYTNLIRHQMNKLNVLFNMSTGYMDMMLNEARGIYDMALNDEQQKANKKAREKGDKVSVAGSLTKFQAKINSGVQEVAEEVINYVKSANEAQFAKRDLEIENWARNPITEDGVGAFIGNFLTGALTELVDEITNVFSIIRAQARMELTQMQTTIASLNAIAIAEYSQKMTSGYTVDASESIDGETHYNVGGIRLWSEQDDTKYEGTDIYPTNQDPTFFGETITKFMDTTFNPQSSGNSAMKRTSKAAISSYLNNMGTAVTVNLTPSSIQILNNDNTLQLNRMLGLALSGFDASFSGGVYDMTRNMNYSINTEALSTSTIFHQTLPESTGNFSTSQAGDASTGSNPVAKFMKILGIDALMNAIVAPLADGLGSLPNGVSGSTSVYVDYHMERASEFRFAANGFQRTVFIALMIQQSILERKLDVATEMFEQQGAKRTNASSGIIKAASQALDTELAKQGSMIEQVHQYSTQITTVANKLIKNRIDYYKNTVLAPIKILKVGLQLGLALAGKALGGTIQGVISGFLASLFLAPLGLSLTAAGLYPLTYWAYAVTTIGGAAIETAFTALELAVENTVWEFQTPVTLQTSDDDVNLPGSGTDREGSNTGYSRFTYKETKYRQQQFDDRLAAMAPSDSNFTLGGNQFYNYVENKFGSLVYNSRSEFNAVAGSATYSDGYQTFTIDNVPIDASYSGQNLGINDTGMRFIEGRGNGYFNYNGILGSVKSQKSAYYQNLIRMHLIILRAMYDAIEGETAYMFGTQKPGGMQKFEGSGFSVVDSILQSEMGLVGDLKSEIQTALEAYNSNAQKQQTLTNLEFTITQNFFDNIFSLTTLIPWGVGEITYLTLSAVGQVLDVTRQFEWGPYAGKLATFHESDSINKREKFAKNLAQTFYNPNENPDTTGWATQYMPASNPQQYVTQADDEESYLKFYQEPYVTGDGRAIGDWLTPGASNADIDRRAVFYELDMLELDTLNVMYRADGSGDNSKYLIKNEAGDYVRSSQTFEAISQMNDLGLVQLEYANISQAQNQLTRIHAIRSMFMMLEQALYNQKQTILKEMFGTSSSAGIMEQTMTLIDNYNNGQLEALNEIVQELLGEVESKNTYEQGILDSIVQYVGLASLMPNIYNSIVSFANPSGISPTATVNLFRRILVKAGQSAFLTIVTQLVIGLIGFFSINEPDKVVSQLVSSEEKDAEESTDKERIDELNNKDQKTMTQAEKNELVSLNAKYSKTAEQKIQNVELDKSDHTKSLQQGPKLSSRGTFTTNAASLSIAQRKLKQKFRKMKLMNEILQSLLDAQSDAAAEVGGGSASKAYKGVSGIISKLESNEKNILQNMFSRQKQIADAKNRSLDMIKKAATGVLTAVMTNVITSVASKAQDRQIARTDKNIANKKKQLDKLEKKKSSIAPGDKKALQKNQQKQDKLKKSIGKLEVMSKDLKELKSIKERSKDNKTSSSQLKADEKRKKALSETAAGKMETRRKLGHGILKAAVSAMAALAMDGLIRGVAEMNGADINEGMEDGADGAFTEGDSGGEGMETADLENASLLADVQKGNFQLLQVLLKDDIDRNKDGAKSFKAVGNMMKAKLKKGIDANAEDKFDRMMDNRIEKLQRNAESGDTKAKKQLAVLSGEASGSNPGEDSIFNRVVNWAYSDSPKKSESDTSSKPSRWDKFKDGARDAGKAMTRGLLRAGAAAKVATNGVVKGVRQTIYAVALTISAGVVAADAAVRLASSTLDHATGLSSLRYLGQKAVETANKRKADAESKGEKNSLFNKGLKKAGQLLSSVPTLKTELLDEETIAKQKEVLSKTTPFRMAGIAADFAIRKTSKGAKSLTQMVGKRLESGAEEGSRLSKIGKSLASISTEESSPFNKDYIDSAKDGLSKIIPSMTKSVKSVFSRSLDDRIKSRAAKSSAGAKADKVKAQLEKQKERFEEFMEGYHARDNARRAEKAASIKDAGEIEIGATQKEKLSSAAESIDDTLEMLNDESAPKNEAATRARDLLEEAKKRARRAEKGRISKEDLIAILEDHTAPTISQPDLADEVFQQLLNTRYAKGEKTKVRDYIPGKKTALGHAQQDEIAFNKYKSKKTFRLRLPKALRPSFMKADNKRDAYEEFEKVNKTILDVLASKGVTGEQAKAIVDEINQFKGRAKDLEAVEKLTAEAYKELSTHVVDVTATAGKLSDDEYHAKHRDITERTGVLTTENDDDTEERDRPDEITRLKTRDSEITEELNRLSADIEAVDAQAALELSAAPTVEINTSGNFYTTIETSLKNKLKYGEKERVSRNESKFITQLTTALAEELPGSDPNGEMTQTPETQEQAKATVDFFTTLQEFKNDKNKTKASAFFKALEKNKGLKKLETNAKKIAAGFKYLTKEQKQEYLAFLGLSTSKASTVSAATQNRQLELNNQRNALREEQETVRTAIAETTRYKMEQKQRELNEKEAAIAAHQKAKTAAKQKLVIESLGTLRLNTPIDAQVQAFTSRQERVEKAEAERAEIEKQLEHSREDLASVTEMLEIRTEQERLEAEYVATHSRLSTERELLNTQKQHHIDKVTRLSDELTLQMTTISDLETQKTTLQERQRLLETSRPELADIYDQITALGLTVDPAHVSLATIREIIGEQVTNLGSKSEGIAAQLETLDQLTRKKTDLIEERDALIEEQSKKSSMSRMKSAFGSVFGYESATATRLAELNESLSTVQDEIDAYRATILDKKSDLTEEENPIRTLLELETILEQRDTLLSTLRVTDLNDLDQESHLVSANLLITQWQLRNAREREEELRHEKRITERQRDDVTRELTENQVNLNQVQISYDTSSAHLAHQLVTLEVHDESYRTYSREELTDRAENLRNEIEAYRRSLNDIDGIIKREKLTPQEIKALEQGKVYLLSFSDLIDEQHENERKALDNELKELEQTNEKEQDANKKRLDRLQKRIDDRNLEIDALTKELERLETIHNAGKAAGDGGAFNPQSLAKFAKNTLQVFSTAIAQNKTLELINRTARQTADLNLLGVGQNKKESAYATDFLLQSAGLDDTPENRFLINSAFAGTTSKDSLAAQKFKAMGNLAALKTQGEFYKDKNGSIKPLAGLEGEPLPSGATLLGRLDTNIDDMDDILDTLLVIKNSSIQINSPTFREYLEHTFRHKDLDQVREKDKINQEIIKHYAALGVTIDETEAARLISTMVTSYNDIQTEFTDTNTLAIQEIVQTKGLSSSTQTILTDQLAAYDAALASPLTPEAKKELEAGRKQAEATLNALTGSAGKEFDTFTSSLSQRYYATTEEERKIGKTNTTSSTNIMTNVLDNIGMYDSNTGSVFADTVRKQYSAIQSEINQEALSSPNSLQKQTKMIELAQKTAHFISERLSLGDQKIAVNMMQNLMLDTQTPNELSAQILSQLHRIEPTKSAEFETKLLENQEFDDYRKISEVIAQGRVINTSLSLNSGEETPSFGMKLANQLSGGLFFDNSIRRMNAAAAIATRYGDASTTNSAKGKLDQTKKTSIKQLDQLISRNPNEALRLISTLSTDTMEANGFADELRREGSKFTGTDFVDAEGELNSSTSQNNFLLLALAQHQNYSGKYTEQEQRNATLAIGKLLQIGALSTKAIRTLELPEELIQSLQHSGHLTSDDSTTTAIDVQDLITNDAIIGDDFNHALGTALINSTLKSTFSHFVSQESAIRNISNSDLVIDDTTGQLIDAKTFQDRLQTLREDDPDAALLDLQNSIPGASQIIETALKEGKSQDVEDILKEIIQIGGGDPDGLLLSSVSLKLLEDIAMHLDDHSRDILLNNGAHAAFKRQQALYNEIELLGNNPVRRGNLIAQSTRHQHGFERVEVDPDDIDAVPSLEGPHQLEQKEVEQQLRSISISLASLTEKEVKALLEDEKAANDIAKALVLGLSLKTQSANLLVSKVLTFLEAQQIGLGGSQVFNTFINKFVDQTIRHNQTTTDAKRIKSEDFYKSLQHLTEQKESILENRIRNGFHVGASMMAVQQLLQKDPNSQSQFIQKMHETKSVDAVRGLNQSLVVAASQTPEQLLALLSAQDNIEVIPGKNKLESTLYLNHMNNMVGIQKEGLAQVSKSRYSDQQLSKLSQFFQGSSDYALSTLQKDTKQPTLKAEDVAGLKEKAQQTINTLNADKLEAEELSDARSNEIEAQLTTNRSIVALADLFLQSQDSLKLSTHFLSENQARYKSPMELLTELSTQTKTASPQEQNELSHALHDLQTDHIQRGVQQLQVLLVKPNTSFTIEQKKVMQQVINKFTGLESPLQNLSNTLETPLSDLQTAFRDEGQHIMRSLDRTSRYMADPSKAQELRDKIDEFQNTHSLNPFKDDLKSDIRALTAELKHQLLPNVSKQIDTLLTTADLISLKEQHIDTDTSALQNGLTTFVSETGGNLLSEPRINGLITSVAAFKETPTIEDAFIIQTYMNDLNSFPNIDIPSTEGSDVSKAAALRDALREISTVANGVISATQDYKQHALINSTIGQLSTILLPSAFGEATLQTALEPTSTLPLESKLTIINNTLIAAERNADIQSVLTSSVLATMTGVLNEAQKDPEQSQLLDTILSSQTLINSFSLSDPVHIQMASILIPISTDQGKSSPLHQSLMTQLFNSIDTTTLSPSEKAELSTLQAGKTSAPLSGGLMAKLDSQLTTLSNGDASVKDSIEQLTKNEVSLQLLTNTPLADIPKPVLASSLPLLKAQQPQRYVQVLLSLRDDAEIAGALPTITAFDMTLVHDNLAFFETLSTMDNTNSSTTSALFTQLLDEGVSPQSPHLLELAFNLNPKGFEILTETSHHAVTADTIAAKIGGADAPAIFAALQDDSLTIPLLDTNGLPTQSFLELDDTVLKNILSNKMLYAGIDLPDSKNALYALLQLRDIEDSRQATLRRLQTEVQTSSSMDSSTKDSIAKTLANTLEKSEHQSKGQFASIRNSANAIKHKIDGNVLTFGGDLASIQGTLLTLPADHRMALETVSQKEFGKPLSSALSGVESHQTQLKTLATLLGHITAQTFPTDPVSVSMAKEAKTHLDEALVLLDGATFDAESATVFDAGNRISTTDIELFESEADDADSVASLGDISVGFIHDPSIFPTIATTPDQASDKLKGELPNLVTSSNARREFTATLKNLFANPETTTIQKENMISTFIALNTPEPGEHVSNSDLSELLNSFTPLEQASKQQLLDIMVSNLDHMTGSNEELFQLVGTLNTHYEGKIPSSVAKTMQKALSKHTGTSLTQLANTNLPAPLLHSIITDTLETKASTSKNKQELQKDIELLKQTLTNPTMLNHYGLNFGLSIVQDYIQNNAQALSSTPDLMTSLYNDAISFAVNSNIPQLLIELPTTMGGNSGTLGGAFQKALLSKTKSPQAQETLRSAISLSLEPENKSKLTSFMSSLGQFAVASGNKNNDISFIYKEILHHGTNPDASLSPDSSGFSKSELKALQQKGYIDSNQQPTHSLHLEPDAARIGQKVGLPENSITELLTFLKTSDAMPNFPISPEGLIDLGQLDTLETSYLNTVSNESLSVTPHQLKTDVRALIMNNPTDSPEEIATKFADAAKLPSVPIQLTQYAMLEMNLFDICNESLDPSKRSFDTVDASLRELRSVGVEQNKTFNALKQTLKGSHTTASIMELGKELDTAFANRTNPFTSVAARFGIDATELLDVMAPHMDGDHPKLASTIGLDLSRFTTLTTEQKADLAAQLKTTASKDNDPRATAFSTLLQASRGELTSKQARQGKVTSSTHNNYVSAFLQSQGNTTMMASILNDLSAPGKTPQEQQMKHDTLSTIVTAQRHELPSLLLSSQLTPAAKHTILATLHENDGTYFNDTSLFTMPLATALHDLSSGSVQEKALFQQNLANLVSDDPDGFDTFYESLPEGPTDNTLSRATIDESGLNPSNIRDAKKDIIKQLRHTPLSGTGFDTATQEVINQMHTYGAIPVLLGILSAESKDGGQLLPPNTASTLMKNIAAEANKNGLTVSEFLLNSTGKSPDTLLALSAIIDQISGTGINTHIESQLLLSLDTLATNLHDTPTGSTHNWSIDDLNRASLIAPQSPLEATTLSQATILSQLLNPSISPEDFKSLLGDLLQSSVHRDIAQSISYSANITSQLLTQIESKTGHKLHSFTELDSARFTAFATGSSALGVDSFNSQFDIGRTNALSSAVHANPDFVDDVLTAFSDYDTSLHTPESLEDLLTTLSNLHRV